jgi:hypothetical protein
MRAHLDVRHGRHQAQLFGALDAKASLARMVLHRSNGSHRGVTD